MKLTKQQIRERIITTKELLDFGKNRGKIEEIIDDDDNIMNDKDKPENSLDNETMASHTTDYNARIHGQNFKNDFLGRFGFYFYESDQDNGDVEKTLAKIMYEKYKETLNHYHENPEKLESDWKLHQSVDFDSQPEGSKEHDFEWASDILKALEPHMKKNISETKVVEDKITDKKEDNSIKNEKDKPSISPDKLKKLDDLFSKMPKDSVDKIIKLLEKYK